VFSMEPLRYPEDDASCSIDGDERHSVTGLNCAGFGSSMVVTATFGMVAASHVLNRLAASVAPAATPVLAQDATPVPATVQAPDALLS
jgi:tRNA A37 threonylcarbamoyladenosine dehydratase